jgi:hypothetical protein
MRRSSHIASTLVLGMIADDIFGALIDASSTGRDRKPRGSMLLSGRETIPADMRLAGYDESAYPNKLAA